VKGVFDKWDSKKTELQEEFSLIDFQMFLFNADERDELNRRPELDFSFFGPGSVSDGALLGARGKISSHATDRNCPRELTKNRS
jgi:hypothetical protein